MLVQCCFTSGLLITRVTCAGFRLVGGGSPYGNLPSLVQKGGRGVASVTGVFSNRRARPLALFASCALLASSLSLLGISAVPAAAAGSGPLLTVVAGGGSGTPSGTPQGATDVALAAPAGIALGANGTLFISDAVTTSTSTVGYVYEVSGGKLSVIAGGGTNAPSTTGQAPTAVALGQPGGLAVDSAGDLFIADSSAKEVDEIQASTGQLVVIAGGGTTAPSTTPSPGTGVLLGVPTGLALTPDGSLLIADSAAIKTGPASSSGEVDLWQPSTGDLSVIAGGGSSPVTTTGAPPTSVNLSAPSG